MRLGTKANAVIDTAVWIVIFAVFAIISVTGYFIWLDISPQIAEDTANSWVANETIDMTTERYPSLFDGLAIFIFVMLWVMALIASFTIDTHPIFFGVSLILLLFVIISSIYIANFYDDYFSDEEFNNVTANFPMTTWVFEHYLTITIVIAMSLLVALYGKQRLG